MNNLQCSLTELEGAILSEIHHRGASTAFKVRKAFEASRSLEWRGSAGAVYAAISRLAARGLMVASQTDSGRQTKLLSVTPDGLTALTDWICDPHRAASVGQDPFRLRSGVGAASNRRSAWFRHASRSSLSSSMRSRSMAFSRTMSGVSRGVS